MLKPLKRIRVVFGAVVLTGAIILVASVPAFAQPTNFFIGPDAVDNQPILCADTEEPIELLTCLPAEIPAGQVCDIPVEFSLVGDPAGEGFRCRVGEATPSPGGGADGGEGGGSQQGGGGGGGQQGGGGLEITQEGEQEAEAGEIDQSFDVS